jgi:hypothetical protein
MSQILRTWTFWIHAAIEDECRTDVEQLILARMRLAPGNRRASVLFKDARDGTLEVVVLSIWDSLKHIKAFVGPDYLQPTISPAHLGKVFDKEPAVHHYAMNEIPPSLRDWTSSGSDQPT